MKIISTTIPNRKALLVGALSVFLSACAAQPQTGLRSIFESEARATASSDEIDSSNEQSAQQQAIEAEEQRLSPLMSEYTVATQTSARVLELTNDEKVTVSFEEVPLKEFVEHVFSNILNVDFVIDPQTSFDGKQVTLQIKEPMGQKAFLDLFNQVLQQHELGIKLERDIVFLHNLRKQRGLPDFDYGYGRTANSVPEGSNPIFHVVPVDYIDKGSVQSFIVRLTNALPENLPDPNLFGLRGSRYDILRALDIVNLLDRPAVRGQNLAFVKLEYVPASLFMSQVRQLLSNEGINVDAVLRFTELSRQNGLIVHARTTDLLDRIVFWQQTLDTPESTDDKQYFMYYPANVEAKKLTEVLDQLVGLSNAGGATTRVSERMAEGSEAGSGSKRSSSAAGSEIDFVTDENRNAIIVFSTATKYKSILPLLKKLDVTPPQVLIEARLLEITLTDQLSQGVDWSLFGGDAKRNIPTSQVSSLTNGSFGYTISGIDYNFALSMLQNEDRLKVLSSPRIVVASGESATINVGTEIPVLATQSADVDTDRVLQSVQYRSTGVDLSVQPTVNSNNVISLEITQNVSETSENASSGIDSPIILNRSFKTSVVANSGQALVLGGLIRENNSSKDSQVPLLGSIPGLGKLFSSESKSTSRTELIVLITPRIISNASDIDELRDLFISEFELLNDEP